jgi:hypothetical protein
MQMLGGRAGGGAGTESRGEPRSAPSGGGERTAAAPSRASDEGSFDDDIPF